MKLMTLLIAVALIIGFVGWAAYQNEAEWNRYARQNHCRMVARRTIYMPQMIGKTVTMMPITQTDYLCERRRGDAMRAIVKTTRFGWFQTVVEAVDGVFNWTWDLGPETPYFKDAEVRANAFNSALDGHTQQAVDLFRPALSMCENAYAGKTEPVKR